MTTEEAFVKVLQKHGIQHAFGIIGSAFMPISDLFPKAGITFWDVAHESNGGIMADGYTDQLVKLQCVLQKWTWYNWVSYTYKTAFGIISMLLVTPQAANKLWVKEAFKKLSK